MLKKGLSVGVIILLTSITIAPTFIADFPNNEMIDFTVIIFGHGRIKSHNVSISNKDAYRLDQTFNDMRDRLNNSNSRDETTDIYNDMVLTIDELGLLPNSCSVKEVQTLITGMIRFSETTNEFSTSNLNDMCENWDCQISGDISNLDFVYSYHYWVEEFEPPLSWWLHIIFNIIARIFPPNSTEYLTFGSFDRI